MARKTTVPAPSFAHQATSAGAATIASRLVATVSCILAIVALIYETPAQRHKPPNSEFTPQATLPTSQSATPSTNVSLLTGPSPSPPFDPPPTADLSTPESTLPSTPHIGIVVGHWGSDTGAMCPDGLMEVEINLDIAERVVHLLQDLGYQVELLAEFDPRLQDYQADALISIHADSCEAFPNASPPASGFKVASVEDSMVPLAEEQLVACLAQCYAARTGMYFHANSITYDMTRYHTFYEIDDQTPAAIIETGFMYEDRYMLTQQANVIARGIVEGIICFIERQ